MKLRNLLIMLILMSLLMTVLSGCNFFETKKKVGSAVDGNEMKVEAAAFSLIKAQQAAGYQLVDTATLKMWVDEGKDMIIIDTMSKEYYDKGHVPGAVHAEMTSSGVENATDEQKRNFEQVLGDDKEKVIVVYCAFTSCPRADTGAIYAMELGYNNVYRYPGGIVAWQDAGFATEK